MQNTVNVFRGARLTVAFVVAAILFSFLPSLLPSTVFAENCPDDANNQSAWGCKYKEFAGHKPDDMAPSVFDLQTIDKALDSGGTEAWGKRPHMGDVLWRLFVPQYRGKMSGMVSEDTFEVPEGYPKAKNAKNGDKVSSICVNDSSNPLAGTPLYHNCDIPNVTMEYLQLLPEFVGQGIVTRSAQNSVTKDVYIPSRFKDKEVPLNYESSSEKYTGLELWGYEFPLVGYTGEWDNIKILSSERSAMFTGLIPAAKIVLQAIVNGVVNAAGEAVDGLVQSAKNFGGKISHLDIIGAFGGFFVDIWKTIIGTGDAFWGAVFSTFLDADDLKKNVNFEWYRSFYPSTAYGVVHLTWQDRSLLQAGITAKTIEKVVAQSNKANDDVNNLKTSVHRKADTCSSVERDDKGRVIASASAGVRWGEDKCPASGGWKYSEKSFEPYTFAQWLIDNKPHIDAVKKYGLSSCTMQFPKDIEEVDKYSIDCVENSGAGKERAGSVQKQLTDKDIKDAADELLQRSINSAISGFNWFAPQNEYVCADKDNKIITDGDGVPTPAFTKEGKLQCAHPMRPPIENAFLGNGYKVGAGIVTPLSAKVPGHAPDTRWVKFHQNGVLGPLVISLRNIITEVFEAQVGAWTKLSNMLLSKSFSPILESLGVTKTVEKIYTNLRDSIFWPFFFTAIIIGGLMLLWKAGVKREFRAGFGDLAKTIFTLALAIILLHDPAWVIKKSEEIPSTAENIAVALMFNGTTSLNGEICSTSAGTSGKIDIRDDTGERLLMCMNWKAFLFNPYVVSQWGTGYSSLEAKSALPAKNPELVGDAAVPMGGGKTEYNWAAYQVKQLKSGTTTTPSQRTTVLPKDIYRMVDLQAGPNGGANRQPQYFDTWAKGGDPGAMLVFIPIAIFGLIVVGTFAVTKIVITIATTLMLVFLPIMLLVGLIPGAGNRKLVKYCATILGLMAQRIILVVALATLLIFINSITETTQSPIVILIGTCGILLVFFQYRKGILAIGGATAAAVIGKLTNAPGQGINALKQGAQGATKLPFVGRKLGKAAFMAKGRVTAFKAGMLNSAIDGDNVGKIISNGFNAQKESASRLKQQYKMRDRRRGHFVGEDFSNIVDAGGNVPTPQPKPEAPSPTPTPPSTTEEPQNETANDEIPINAEELRPHAEDAVPVGGERPQPQPGGKQSAGSPRPGVHEQPDTDKEEIVDSVEDSAEDAFEDENNDIDVSVSIEDSLNAENVPGNKQNVVVSPRAQTPSPSVVTQLPSTSAAMPDLREEAPQFNASLSSTEKTTTTGESSGFGLSDVLGGDNEENVSQRLLQPQKESTPLMSDQQKPESPVVDKGTPAAKPEQKTGKHSGLFDKTREDVKDVLPKIAPEKKDVVDSVAEILQDSPTTTPKPQVDPNSPFVDKTTSTAAKQEKPYFGRFDEDKLKDVLRKGGGDFKPGDGGDRK